MIVKYACEEHMDEAMDDVINEQEKFPIINNAKGNKCAYCDKECSYEVKVI